MPLVIDPTRSDLGGNIRHGDLRTWCPRLWKFLADRFAIRSVLDVGCGEGHTVKFFHDLGLASQGIEGLPRNVSNSVHPIALHDLTSGPFIMPVNLVWSCEVAEHIEEQFVDNYLASIANGKVIAMTHATPQQGGHHHVNCQPPEYWIEKLDDRGYYLSEDNEEIRKIASREDSWNYFQPTGLVFLRK